MVFWRKKPGNGGTSPSDENPFRSYNPEKFDTGEKINRKADDLRQLAGAGMTGNEALVALNAALGQEIAAMIRRQPELSSEKVSHMLEMVLDSARDGAREQAELALEYPFKNQQGAELSGDQFDDLAKRIINTATHRTIPQDAIAATAKALGVIIAFTARQEDVSYDELMKRAQYALTEFGVDARARLD